MNASAAAIKAVHEHDVARGAADGLNSPFGHDMVIGNAIPAQTTASITIASCS
jgi:hypothetical protein